MTAVTTNRFKGDTLRASVGFDWRQGVAAKGLHAPQVRTYVQATGRRRGLSAQVTLGLVGSFDQYPRATWARLTSVRMPSAGEYSPVYNPGRPGSHSDNNPPVPFTVPSSDQTVQITHPGDEANLLTYVEVAGPVTRNAVTGQPIGADWGLAVFDTATGHTIHQYMDPEGNMFYSSFAVIPDYAIALTPEQPSTYSRTTNDHITGAVAIDTVTFSGSQTISIGMLPWG